jgi:transglutaminase-like putative cysteine protease
MARKRLVVGLLLGIFAFTPCCDLKSAPRANSAATNRKEQSSESAKLRKFTFEYRFLVKGLQPKENKSEKVVRIWMPCPPSDEFQQVSTLLIAAPGKVQQNIESRYGNRVQYIETKTKKDSFQVLMAYDVTRHEVRRTLSSESRNENQRLSDSKRALYLEPNKLVPNSGKPLKLLDAVNLQEDKLKKARQLYDFVDSHVTYKKDGTGWGRGDSNWVCDSGYGNCTDFHSLFMSLARSQGIPVRFEIGFSIPTDKPSGHIAGYHCWAWFYLDDRGWIPVDISEADKHPEMKDYYFGNLTADRVMFSTGRDLVLVPKPNSGPVNFLIYPYVEVDGKPLPQENVELQFTYNDPPK